MSEPTLEAQVEGLPEKPGVYIMKGEGILYVGKASNIKERVRNHIQAAKANRRESLIVDSTNKIEYIITGSEVEALVEENILIKQYKPKYNIRLSDDKTYPYLKLSLNEEYPTLTVVRRPKKDNNRYFGPYADVSAMWQSLNTLRRLFPLRACSFDPRKPRRRPCTYYQMGHCSGICAGLISKDEYNERVKSLLLVLEGKTDLVIKKLQREMLEASANLEYERAALVRDRIKALEKTLSSVSVVFPKFIDLDVLGVAKAGDEACVQVLQVKGGKLISSESYELNAQDAEDEEIMESFIKQYYARRVLSPPEIIVSAKIKDVATIQRWLLERFGSETIILRNVRGRKRQLLKLAVENARSHIDNLVTRKRKALQGVQELQRALRLSTEPLLIECFDVSNLSGRFSVGSMVVFEKGEPLKSSYRRFKIKTVVRQDDPQMISELVQRRYRRLLEEKAPPPDLIIVDGGITQANAAKRSLARLGLDLPVAGIAKRLEHIYLPERNQPIVLREASEGLYLIQRIRDEAHRFAVMYHRRLRAKAAAPS
ncbi:excinuclease ABC subunit UvrC [Candidatus Bathyarchaeota archaeon]|nr:excinuclease ABC subunit UvrC [Candidatus Bathyarchaeota archaeon]